MSMCRMRRIGIGQSSISSRPKPSSRHLPDLRDLLPADTGRREDDPLRDAITAADLDRGVGHIQHLYHDFVIWSRVVGIDHADAVRDDQATLQRRAAAGENSQK